MSNTNNQEICWHCVGAKYVEYENGKGSMKCRVCNGSGIAPTQEKPQAPNTKAEWCDLCGFDHVASRKYDHLLQPQTMVQLSPSVEELWDLRQLLNNNKATSTYIEVDEWQPIVNAITALITQAEKREAIAELGKLQDRAHIDESFNYYNPNDWDAAIFERIAQLKAQLTKENK